MWLQDGRIVWAERARQHRDLGHALSELLSIDQRSLRALAQSWRERRVSWVDALLAEPRLELAQVRAALQEHLREALFPLTTNPSCRHWLEAAPAAQAGTRANLSFAPEEILCRPGAPLHERESLLQLAERVYGARSIDVVVDGHAAGFGGEPLADQRLLEAADALLFGADDDSELVVLRSVRGIWAGLRAAPHDEAASTWLAFEPELGLGAALMGLRTLLPGSADLRSAPVLPSLALTPSLFPAAPGRVDYRGLLDDALRLGDGGLAAHVFERDAVAWGSVSRPHYTVLYDCLSRANSALDLCAAGSDDDHVGAQQGAFVLLAGPHGFHLGGRVPGAERASLFLSFAAGASYGQSVAALSVGLSALSRHLQD